MSWFVPKNQKLMGWLSSIASPFLYLFSCLIIILCITTWYYVILPMHKQEQMHYRQQLAGLNSNRAQLAVSDQHVMLATSELQEMKNRYAQLTKNSVADNNFLMHTINEARKHGLHVQSSTIEQKNDARQIALNLEGSSANIAAFFTYLFDQPAIVDCLQLSLTTKNNTTQQLSCTLAYKQLPAL